VEPKFTSALKSSKPPKKHTSPNRSITEKQPPSPNKICYLTKRKLPIRKQRNYLTTSKNTTTENQALNQFMENQNLSPKHTKRGVSAFLQFFCHNLPKWAKLTDGYTNNNPFNLFFFNFLFFISNVHISKAQKNVTPIYIKYTRKWQKQKKESPTKL
jgi:hypothetical protein